MLVPIVIGALLLIALLVGLTRKKDKWDGVIATLVLGGIVAGFTLFALGISAFDSAEHAYVSEGESQVCTRETVEYDPSWFIFWAEPFEKALIDSSVSCVDIPQY